VSAGDQVRFVPQTLPAAYRERLELDAKVALLRRAASSELDEKNLMAAFEVRIRGEESCVHTCIAEGVLYAAHAAHDARRRVHSRSVYMVARAPAQQTMRINIRPYFTGDHVQG